jgi:hypothetical protein
VKEPRERNVMATVKGVHGDNRPDIEAALARTMRIDPQSVELFDMTAAQLLRDLRLKISMRVG